MSQPDVEGWCGSFDVPPELSCIANLVTKRKFGTWRQFEYHQTDGMIPVKGDVKACLIRIVA